MDYKSQVLSVTEILHVVILLKFPKLVNTEKLLSVQILVIFSIYIVLYQALNRVRSMSS